MQESSDHAGNLSPQALAARLTQVQAQSHQTKVWAALLLGAVVLTGTAGQGWAIAWLLAPVALLAMLDASLQSQAARLAQSLGQAAEKPPAAAAKSVAAALAERPASVGSVLGGLGSLKVWPFYVIAAGTLVGWDAANTRVIVPGRTMPSVPFTPPGGQSFATNNIRPSTGPGPGSRPTSFPSPGIRPGSANAPSPGGAPGSPARPSAAGIPTAPRPGPGAAPSPVVRPQGPVTPAGSLPRPTGVTPTSTAKPPAAPTSTAPKPPAGPTPTTSTPPAPAPAPAAAKPADGAAK